jgi:hypothetical protein
VKLTKIVEIISDVAVIVVAVAAVAVYVRSHSTPATGSAMPLKRGMAIPQVDGVLLTAPKEHCVGPQYFVCVL